MESLMCKRGIETRQVICVKSKQILTINDSALGDGGS